MYITDCIKFSFKGLLSKKSRFFLTVISIFIGIMHCKCTLVRIRPGQKTTGGRSDEG